MAILDDDATPHRGWTHPPEEHMKEKPNMGRMNGYGELNQTRSEAKTKRQITDWHRTAATV